MSKKDAALKLALEWIEDAVVVLSHTSSSVQGGVGAEAEGVGGCSVKVVAAIREALAEQLAQGCDYCSHPQYAGTKCKNCGREQPAQQEPVAWYDEEMDSAYTASELGDGNTDGLEPLYTHPQAREPLTDEQIDALWHDAAPYYDHHDFARAIEAAHGIGEKK